MGLAPPCSTYGRIWRSHSLVASTQEEWNRDAFLEALVYYDRDVHREKTPAAYQDLVRQRQIRLKEVRDRGLDLYRLFAETLARGGFNAMICEDAATVSAGPGGFRRAARPHPPRRCRGGRWRPRTRPSRSRGRWTRSLGSSLRAAWNGDATAPRPRDAP